MSTNTPIDKIAEGEKLCKEMKEISARLPYELGKRCKQIRDKDLKPADQTYGEFISANTGFSKAHIYRFISYFELVDNLWIKSHRPETLPDEFVVRPLSKLKAIEDRRVVWEEVNSNGHPPTAETVKAAVEKRIVSVAQPKTKKGEPNRNVFNWTNENIDWAKWSWNPVTGCKHNCKYCYAHDIGMRFDKHFNPAEHLYRLTQPKTTVIPPNLIDMPGIHNVFVCSMADLFGDWVPEEWVEKVLNTIRDNPQWNYILLTKNPKRLVKYEWPDHAWVGTTVDIQERVDPAEKAFKDIKAKVKFISAEPLSSKLVFKKLSLFDWVIIGGRSKSSKMPAAQPEWEWVESLLMQAREAGCKVYFKPNLSIVPKEYPDDKGGDNG
jgi:protein gp37